MKSQTSLVAQQTRLRKWAEQIKECQNRPQGMKIDEWCQMHGITKANYYWRLRKVREAFLETTDITPTFVELPAPMPVEATASTTPKVVAILKGTNHLTLEITDQAPSSFLNALLGAMNHAQ